MELYGLRQLWCDLEQQCIYWSSLLQQGIVFYLSSLAGAECRWSLKDHPKSFRRRFVRFHTAWSQSSNSKTNKKLLRRQDGIIHGIFLWRSKSVQGERYRWPACSLRPESNGAHESVTQQSPKLSDGTKLSQKATANVWTAKKQSTCSIRKDIDLRID